MDYSLIWVPNNWEEDGAIYWDEVDRAKMSLTKLGMQNAILNLLNQLCLLGSQVERASWKVDIWNYRV